MAVDVPSSTGTAGAAAPAPARRLGALASWEATIIALTVLVLVIASLTVDGFGDAGNAVFLLLDITPILLIALPMTLIVMTGEIDLSVASILGLTGAVMGSLWVGGMAIETIIPLCLVLGAVLGAVNGFFVTVLGLPSLAVTIGTLALYRGLAYVVLGSNAVADFPFAHTGWVTGTAGGGVVPNLLLPLLVAVVAFGIALHATPAGRGIVATGASDTAARFAGLATLRIKFTLFVLSGVVSALTGVLWALRYSSARADNGAGLELAVVAAVLLGGVSIFGGKGSLPGVVAAVVLLASLQNALRLENVSNEALTVVTGGLLIASVLAPNVLRAVRRRSASARASRAR
ncbi:rhamnose transport system permease protein [Kineococcus xinjiangensis]|uniref:Autoinducer 2 import system permease protein LsrD n=1 Tax=Kineococcus xinjiangensis TaxID=512762 RepID=A0A2S6IUQ8_9ACTN|nr:ABC transporter permease [Kineococcus xinjiangensis]PPK98007.1 rhamnose transport system permease protein [Kineococcus xinjiangensis]